MLRLFMIVAASLLALLLVGAFFSFERMAGATGIGAGFLVGFFFVGFAYLFSRVK